MAELEIPEGVQAFNLWTIHIMARLWEEFPRPQYFHNNPNIVFVTSDATVAGTQLGPEGQVALFQCTSPGSSGPTTATGKSNCRQPHAAATPFHSCMD
jgi:hypothetical protein